MKDFLELIYLDKSFISGLYEEISGESPETKITTTDNLNAALKIPLASGGASFSESRTYTTSTHGMLKKLSKKLDRFSRLDDEVADFWDGSKYLWVEGEMTLNIVVRSKNKKIENRMHKEIIGEDAYFVINAKKHSFALISTDDYFSSGIAALKSSHKGIAGPIEIPVKGLLRIISAQSLTKKEWIAIPLVMKER